jgi:hypothetical protein
MALRKRVTGALRVTARTRLLRRRAHGAQDRRQQQTRHEAARRQAGNL